MPREIVAMFPDGSFIKAYSIEKLAEILHKNFEIGFTTINALFKSGQRFSASFKRHQKIDFMVIKFAETE